MRRGLFAGLIAGALLTATGSRAEDFQPSYDAGDDAIATFRLPDDLLNATPSYQGSYDDNSGDGDATQNPEAVPAGGSEDYENAEDGH